MACQIFNVNNTNVTQNKDDHLQTVFMLCIHSDTKGAVIAYNPTLKKIFHVQI